MVEEEPPHQQCRVDWVVPHTLHLAIVVQQKDQRRRYERLKQYCLFHVHLVEPSRRNYKLLKTNSFQVRDSRGSEL